MLIVNTESIQGKNYETLGLVKGSIVTSKNIGSDFLSGLKTIVGGELKEYSKMLDEARDIATSRMIKSAEELGANAIVNVRFASSAIMQGSAEMIVYGTAVKYLD